MRNLLEKIDEIFEKLDRADKLAAPISNEELATLSQSLPFELPPAIKDLYRWHNGIEEFIPAFDFIPLQDAIVHYNGLFEFYQSLEEFSDGIFYKETYFPIIQQDDTYLIVDCDPSAEPLVYEVCVEEGENPHKQYESLEQMLRVFVDAYLCRAFYQEDESLYDNPVLFERVKNKYLSEAQLAEKEKDWERRSREAEALLKSSDAKNNSFIQRLEESLHHTYDERAIPYLQKFLSSSEPEVIASAAFGLGELRSRESLPDVVKLLEHPAKVVRDASICAIAKIISPDDVLLLQPLLERLNDSSMFVRTGTVRALGNLRSRAAVEPLIACLQKTDSWLRSQVIRALQKIGGSKALEALRQAQKEGTTDWEAREIDCAIHFLEKREVKKE